MGIEADIGRIIDHRYRLDKPVGRGGMSVVWQAEHLALEAPVAVKLGTFVASSEAEAESRIARFRREARSLARIEVLTLSKSSISVSIINSPFGHGVP